MASIIGITSPRNKNMKDKENSNIEYRQASLAQIAIFILFISIAILGAIILTIYFITTVSDKGFNTTATISLIADIFLLISIALNLFVVSKIIKYKYDDRPILYIVLTFLSLNLPCGIMMLVRRVKEKEELEEE